MKCCGRSPGIMSSRSTASLTFVQGHLAAKKWHHGLAEAEMLGDDAITAAIVDDPDLHDHVTKGLYEAKLAG